MKIENTSLFANWFWYTSLVFLALSCLTRLVILFASTPVLLLILGVVGVVLIFVPIYKPSYLKSVLFCFAVSFPLYGSFPYSSHSFLFEFYLTIVALLILLKFSNRRPAEQTTTIIPCLLFSYFILAFFSLSLLPIQDIFWKFILWDWHVVWNAVFFATPESSLYSVAAIHRYVLFFIFVVLLAGLPNGKDLYKTFFIGLLGGSIWASVIGILSYYKIINLDWFRDVAEHGLRLQSVFANPGWFAEFLAVTIPYILIGFMSSQLKPVHKIGLFALLVICEIAIILTYSRTGWIIYPLVLVVCWFSFYIATQAHAGRFKRWQIARVSLKVIVSVPLTIIVSYLLIFNIFSLITSADLPKEGAKLEKRIDQITNPFIRLEIWSDSMELIKKKPIFGLGYESYKFQNRNLKTAKRDMDTPHNTYLQLLVSGGIVGLAVWGLLILATLYLLVVDLVKNRAYFNIAVILSIIAFHLYGFAQSMQYIPMIWFLIFLNIGYAMTLDEKLLPLWIYRKKTALALLLMGVVFSGLIAYGYDFESKKLAAKHELDIYSLDQELNNYLGFYSKEHWGEQGVYRWTGSSAIIKLPLAELFELTFVCSAPDLPVDPVVLSIYEEDRQIDEIVFQQPQSITRQYAVSGAEISQKRLTFSVSRTWNLKKHGVANDSRNLGVAISEPKIIK